jgi:hypothetical protein
MPRLLKQNAFALSLALALFVCSSLRIGSL